MSSRVLFVNHGPKVVMLEVYQKRTGVIGVFAPDALLSESPIAPGTELAAFVNERQYTKVVERE